MTIGERIKLLRENRNLSLDDVNKATNIELKKLKRIENNLYIPTREEIQSLAAFFECKEKEIVNDETVRDTEKIYAKISFHNFIYWIMNVIVYVFYMVVAFIPTLNVTESSGNNVSYSFYTLLMSKNNPLVMVSFVFAAIGLLISLFLIIVRFLPSVKLSEKVLLILNLILLAILILTVVTLFIVIVTYSNDFVKLIS